MPQMPQMPQMQAVGYAQQLHIEGEAAVAAAAGQWGARLRSQVQPCCLQLRRLSFLQSHLLSMTEPGSAAAELAT